MAKAMLSLNLLSETGGWFSIKDSLFWILELPDLRKTGYGVWHR